MFANLQNDDRTPVAQLKYKVLELNEPKGTAKLAFPFSTHPRS